MLGTIGLFALWLLAWGLSWPQARVWLASAVWWLVVLAISAPPLREVLGLSPRPASEFRFWLIFGIVLAVVLGYRQWLLQLRRKALAATPAAPATAREGGFSEAERNRYARHIMLREIGGQGQQRLARAKVLVVGAGGLGSPVLLTLAGAGVGVIGVIDDDLVEASNLQRQFIHTDERLGMPKVFSAEQAMKALNPFIEVRPYQRRLDEPVAAALIADYDLVLDGTDNFETRLLVNRTCAGLGKPLISGAISQWEGQLSLYDPARGAPCYECLFPEMPAAGLVPNCAEAGVAAPLPAVIGAMMASEAVKEITGAGEGLRGRLMIHDALYAETRVIRVRPRADCPVCGGH